MDFLSPTAFWGLALALPIIALYLIRRRAIRRQVSTLLFWELLESAEHNRALWRKLRQWVSLALQLLLLCLLVGALAKPLWSGGSKETRTIIVLDRSASMAAGSWQEATDSLRKELRALGSGDEVLLLATSENGAEVLQPWSISRRAILEAVNNTEPARTEQPLKPALDLANELAAEQAHASIVVMTDGNSADLEQVKDSAVPLRLPMAAKPRVNAGITHFIARRSTSLAGEYTLQAQVAAPAEEPLVAELNRYVDRQLVDVRQIELEPGKTWEIDWQQRSNQMKTVRLELVVEGRDDWDKDNEATLVIRPLPHIAVNIVGEAHPFLLRALESLQAVSIKQLPADAVLDADALAARELWVFPGTTPPETWQAPSLIINPRESGFWGVRTGEVSEPLIARQDEQSPLLRHVQLDQVLIRKASAFEPPVSANILASTPDSDFLFSRWDDGGRWLLLPFDLADSDLMLRTAFPILLGNLVQTVRGSEEVFIAGLPGISETQMRDYSVDLREQAGANQRGWLAGLPLWWWLVALAVVWCAAEWWSFTRKVTE